MTDQDVKSLHDGIYENFGVNRHMLLGILYHLAGIAQEKNMCVWPVDPKDKDIGALEMAIFHANTRGYNRSSIFFKNMDEENARDVVMEINDRLFNIDHFQAKKIVDNSLYNKRKADQEKFNKALIKVLASIPAEQLIQIPGVYEAVSESCNDLALDILERYRANPAMNSLEIKYTTRELLEIVLADLKNIKEEAESQKIPSVHGKLKEKIKRAEQSIELADGHLETMQTMIDGRTIQ